MRNELTIAIDGTTIGQRLRQVRRMRDMTQDDLGEAVGMVRTAVAKIENGYRQMTATELFSIARVLCVAPETFDPDSD